MRNDIAIRLAQINAIKEMAKLAREGVYKGFTPASEKLQKTGAHESRLEYLGDIQRCVIARVENMECEKLRGFRLHELIPCEIALNIPVVVGRREMVLVNPVGTDTAFLIHDIHNVFTVTSYKLHYAKLQFNFVCGCSNCNRDLVDGALELLIGQVAAVAREHGIKNVVMRHNSKWPEGPARAVDVSLLEIGCEQNHQRFYELDKRLETFEGSKIGT